MTSQQSFCKSIRRFNIYVHNVLCTAVLTYTIITTSFIYSSLLSPLSDNYNLKENSIIISKVDVFSKNVF